MVLDSESVEVSIVCATYNHEKYIAKAIEGFVSQETSFKYEIIIHDDASSDNTYEIINTYQNKYDNIICIHQEENQFSKVDIGFDIIFKKVSGKYIAFCDGDDYWHDSHKLQIMYDALRQRPDCAFAAHRVICCNEDGSANSCSIPQHYYGINGDMVISAHKIAEMLFVNKGYPFHTSSYLFRRDIIDNSIPKNWNYISRDIDYLKAAITLGDVVYIDRAMSTRRLDVTTGWNYRMDSKKWEQQLMRDVIANEKYDLYSDYVFHSEISQFILNTCMFLIKNNPQFSKEQMKYVSNKIGIYNFLRKMLIKNCPQLLSKIMRIRDKA